MDFTDFKTGKNDEGRRLDKVIRIFLSEVNLSQIYKLIRKGLIKVNNKKTKADYKIQCEDIISIASFLCENKNTNPHTQIKPSENQKTLADNQMPKIIFENQHLLIIDKPYDVNVHGDEQSLDKIISDYYNNNYKNNDNSLSFKTGPLHRLDKKTTGLLAFSLSQEGAKWFTENINNHSIQKKYYSILQGTITNKETWTDFITNENDNENGFYKVSANSKKENDNSQEAITIVTPLENLIYKNQPVTFVSIEIKTGRKHQIRSQSALHNHALIGDVTYGSKKINESRDFYLCAYELTFPENPLNLPEKISIPLPDDFETFLKYCENIKTGL